MNCGISNNIAFKNKLLVVASEDVDLRLATFSHLRSVGFDIAIAAPGSHQSFIKMEIPVFHYDLIRDVSPFADLRSARQLRNIIKKWSPDIIHAYDTKPCYITPLALLGLGGPKVLRTINGMGKIFSVDNYKNRFLRLIYKCLHQTVRQRVDHTIFQNSTDRDYFVENGLTAYENTSLIPGSGIDHEYLGSFKDKRDRAKKRALLKLNQKITYIMIARLTTEKGVLDFLNAARNMRNRHPNTAFVLVGPAAGDEPGGIDISLINEYADDVIYLGRRNDIPQLLNASDIFVLPTRYREGVPRAMLEAMAMELPVIVSDVPGCREAVIGRGSGFLISGAGAKPLTETMEVALNSNLETMGTVGLKDIQNIYSLPIIMNALTQVYRGVL